MAEKAFTQIKEAESQAQELIKNAGDEALQIIKSAEKSAEDSFLRFSGMCKQQALDKKIRAETESKTAAVEFSNETDKLCAELKKKLLAKKSKAVDAVIGIIINHA